MRQETVSTLPFHRGEARGALIIIYIGIFVVTYYYYYYLFIVDQ